MILQNIDILHINVNHTQRLILTVHYTNVNGNNDFFSPKGKQGAKHRVLQL